MSQFLLYLLGSFKAHIDDQTEALEFRTEKERALLSFLVVESDRAHTRDALAELFWPDRPEGIARTNLRQALAGIRRSIGDRESRTPFLSVTDETIRFDLDRPSWLDAANFSNLINRTRSHFHEDPNSCSTCRDNLEAALDIYRGDFLSGLSVPKSHRFQEWTFFYREHYFRQLMIALDHLSDYYYEAGDYDQAYTHTWRQVRVAPLEENVHRRLMKILAASGRRSAALEQYQTCQRVLKKDLGIDPSIETKALYEQIRKGLTIQPVASMPQQSLAAWPVPLTPFFGREKLLAHLATCMPNPACRLLTFIGTAGVGKTRLAYQTIESNRDIFSDGVYNIPVDDIKSVDEFPQAVARTLGIEADQSPRLIPRIMDRLKPRHALIFIDQFGPYREHTDFLLDILKFAPGIKILLTSRRKLNYQAACLFKLEGLTYPETATISDAPNYPAVKLFVSRAERIRASFALEENLPAVVEICRLLGGLPLALELAAARLREYPCSEIAENIRNNYQFLHTSLGDIRPRHRSMQAAIDYSWDLLSAREKEIYQKLAVFPGSFNLEAARNVTGADLSTLASFVDQSLLTGNAARGFSYYPLVREHARAKLFSDPGEFGRIESRYQSICDPDSTRETANPWLLSQVSIPDQPPGDIKDGDQATFPLSMETLEPDPKRRFATTDPLTNLPNRLVFEDRLDHAITLAIRHQSQIAVMILKVSRPIESDTAAKSPSLERVLPAVATRLRRIIRESDTVARVGTVEFGIILENIHDPESVSVVADKVSADISTLFKLAGRAQELRVNIGIGLFPSDGSDCHGLLRRALLALQKATDSSEIAVQISPT